MSDATRPVASAPMQRATLLPALYATEQTYGWSIGMRAITHALLAAVTLPPGPVLEIGCGAGALMAEMAAQHGDKRFVGLDLHGLALTHAQCTLAAAPRGDVAALVQADMQQLPFPSGIFGTIFALDTYDQFGVDLAAALAESHRVLRPGGLLLLRVSAHDWLYSPHDLVFNTARRYSQPQMADVLCRTGFTPLRSTHANSALLVPVAALRLLQRAGLLKLDASLYTSTVANHLVSQILRWEARWLCTHNLPTGISLYMLARRQ